MTTDKCHGILTNYEPLSTISDMIYSSFECNVSLFFYVLCQCAVYLTLGLKLGKITVALMLKNIASPFLVYWWLHIGGCTQTNLFDRCFILTNTSCLCPLILWYPLSSNCAPWHRHPLAQNGPMSLLPLSVCCLPTGLCLFLPSAAVSHAS